MRGYEHVFKDGETVSLRTQARVHADGTQHVHYYPHWDDLLACEGDEAVTLNNYEAEALNKYGGFSR